MNSKVYIGKVETYCHTDRLPAYVYEQLVSVCQKAADEKRAGYGLLTHALSCEEVQADVRNCYLSEIGKPMHKDFWFSISHSNGLVAVVIADEPIGIDLECSSNRKVSERVLNRILHANEREEDVLVLWTKKEAAFKYAGKESRFHPELIDTTAYDCETTRFERDGATYVLSLVTGER